MVEKSKKWAIVVVGLLLIAVIAGAGCIDEKAPEEGEQESAGEGTTPTAQTPTAPSSSAGTSLSDLLERAKGSTSATYDLVISGGGMGTMTSKVWSTETKERVDSTIMGKKSITIIDKEEQVMYMYDPNQNTAIRMDLGAGDTGRAQSFIEIMEEYNPTVIGTETMDGKKCTIIEYESTVGDASVIQKVWIWEKYGAPIRVEMVSTLGGTPVTTVMEMKNIEFGPIDDSMFKLPDDVEITEMPSGLPNIPGGMK